MLKTIALSLALLVGAQAFAGQMAYDAKAFQAAGQAGKKTVLQFHAGWCPVCVKQDKAVAGLAADARFQDVTIFKVDYDQEKELRKEHHVMGQSTLLFFSGKKEVSRSQGVTDKAAVEADLKKLAGM